MDFKNTLIVMTSNLGSHLIQSMAGDDPGLTKLTVTAEVRGHFRPEFVSRIEVIVVFHAVNEKDIGAIAKIQLRQTELRLLKMNMTREVSDATPQKISDAGYDPVYGALPPKRDPTADRKSAIEADLLWPV